VLDLGALPPEITSALMYAGPGSESLQAAASAWNGLAAELSSAANGYNAVITQLAGDEWLGPASTSMADAAAPYVTWMNTTAAQAEQAATSARAAAAAYEAAHAAVVPPQLVAANRTQTAQLLSTNVLGQNTPAIAQLQAQYGEMWAQDAAAMYGYAGQAATATKMAQFDPPALNTNPAGQTVQAAAVTQAAGTATGTSALSQAQSGLNGLLGNLASPTGIDLGSLLGLPTFSLANGGANILSFPSNSLIGSLLTGLGGSSTINPAWFIGVFRNFAGPAYNIEGLPYFSTGMANTLLSLQKGLAPAAAKAAEGAAGAAAGAAGGAGGLGGLGGVGGLLGGGPVSAGLGNAGAIGKLAVPPSWIGGAPLEAPHAPLPVSSIAAAPEGAGAGNLLGGMPLAGAGGGIGGGSAPKYGFRPTIMARPPFAG
jgi:PPE-repeat protein